MPYPPFSCLRRRPFTAAPRAVPAARVASIKVPERARRCFCRPLCLTRSFTSATRVSLLYTLRTPPLPKRRSCQNAKRTRPAHGMTVDAARPLKRRYEILIVRRKKGQTYAAVCRQYIAEKHCLSSPLFLNITKRRELSLRPQLDIKIHSNYTGRAEKINRSQPQK